MLVTVLILSGTILGAVAIAGLLMIYQVRQTTNVANSTKAIFAADAGLECEFYNRIKDGVEICDDILFTNDVSADDADDVSVVTTVKDNIIQSVGNSGDTSRAFKATF